MLKLQIPGRGEYRLENILFDYNGTLAVDGAMDNEIKAKLKELSSFLNVYILTADTYGTVEKECGELDLGVKTFPRDNAGLEKNKILQEVGKEKSIAVGNGYNDILMLKESNLSFVVLGKEGCCGELILNGDIIFNSIYDVFDALNNPDRIKATLRS